MSSKTYFKEVAQEWDNMAESFFGEKPKQAISSLIDWNRVKVAADLGCGSGYLTDELLSKEKHVIAIDQSQEMLDVVSNKFQSEHLTTRQGDGGQIPISEGEIDLAVANMFLHHVDDPSQTINEAYRILKTGGQWVFTDLDSHNHDFLVTEQHDKWMGFERDDIKKWMESAGFKNVEIDCVGAECCANSGCGPDNAKISIFVAKGEK